ncbi:MAG: phosphoribosyltransferase family protein [Candidatus Margulisiibacteriota bacterium]
MFNKDTNVMDYNPCVIAPFSGSISDKVIIVPDYPGIGGMFPKLDDLHADPAAFRKVISMFCKFFKAQGVTKVVGIAARGMPFAAVAAEYLNVPYVIIGKGGKMPGRKISEPAFEHDYIKEPLVMEVGIDKIESSDRIGIIDDNIASGAYMRTAISILQASHASIVGIATVTSFEDILKGSRFGATINAYPRFSCLRIDHTGEISENNTYSDDNVPVSEKINTYSIDYLKKLIRIYPHFPRSGIMWTDFGEIQFNPSVYKYVVASIANRYKNKNINKVVSFAVRGIDFGASIANYLGVSHVIAGKLEGIAPEPTISMQFGMEYACVTLGIPVRLIKPEDNILLIDDITATSGTLDAGKQIIEALNAKLAGAATIIGLTDVMKNSGQWKRSFKGTDILYNMLNFSDAELIEMSKILRP